MSKLVWASALLCLAKQQGLVQTAGYQEQQQSYLALQQAANTAASADKFGAIGSFIGAGISMVAAL